MSISLLLVRPIGEARRSLRHVMFDPNPSNRARALRLGGESLVDKGTMIDLNYWPMETGR
jgi:hypothetical protein